jgi:hypothetical protein
VRVVAEKCLDLLCKYFSEYCGQLMGRETVYVIACATVQPFQPLPDSRNSCYGLKSPMCSIARIMICMQVRVGKKLEYRILRE